MKFFKILTDLFGKKETSKNEKITEVGNTEGVFTEADLMRCLEKSKMQTVKIEATPQENLPLVASKFLGTPYFPKDKEYPKDAQDKPMILLAQLNFAEIPHLENYPTEGILQFFISANHDYYGSDLAETDYFGNFISDTPKKANYSVIYHTIIDEKLPQITLPVFNFEEINLPIHTEHALRFSLEEEYVPVTDWRHHSYFQEKNYSKLINDDKLSDKYYESFESTGHKIGGYAYFTQEDPRNAKRGYDLILLLQIDSVGDEIMWGDVGVANFFITEQDLKNKDFSRVFYTWDCC